MTDTPAPAHARLSAARLADLRRWYADAFVPKPALTITAPTEQIRELFSAIEDAEQTIEMLNQERDAREARMLVLEDQNVDMAVRLQEAELLAQELGEGADEWLETLNEVQAEKRALVVRLEQCRCTGLTPPSLVALLDHWVARAETAEADAERWLGNWKQAYADATTAERKRDALAARLDAQRAHTERVGELYANAMAAADALEARLEQAEHLVSMVEVRRYDDGTLAVGFLAGSQPSVADFIDDWRALAAAQEQAEQALSAVREIIAADPDEDTLAALRLWMTEREHYARLADESQPRIAALALRLEQAEQRATVLREAARRYLLAESRFGLIALRGAEAGEEFPEGVTEARDAVDGARRTLQGVLAAQEPAPDPTPTETRQAPDSTLAPIHPEDQRPVAAPEVETQQPCWICGIAVAEGYLLWIRPTGYRDLTVTPSWLCRPDFRRVQAVLGTKAEPLAGGPAAAPDDGGPAT